MVSWLYDFGNHQSQAWWYITLITEHRASKQHEYGAGAEELTSQQPGSRGNSYLMLDGFLLPHSTYFYVYKVSLHVCLYIMCMPGAHRNQKRIPDFQELELQL